MLWHLGTPPRAATAAMPDWKPLCERMLRVEEDERIGMDELGQIAASLPESERLEAQLGDLRLQRRHLAQRLAVLGVAVADQLAPPDVADAIRGINTEGHRKELERARAASNRLKSSAKLSNKLAGMDGKSQREKFRQKAQKKKAASEFAALVGLSKSVDEAAQKEPAQVDADKTASLESD